MAQARQQKASEDNLRECDPGYLLCIMKWLLGYMEFMKVRRQFEQYIVKNCMWCNNGNNKLFIGCCSIIIAMWSGLRTEDIRWGHP